MALPPLAGGAARTGHALGGGRFSSKTQSLLRRALKDEGPPPPVEVEDAETGEKLILNEVTVAMRAKESTPFAHTKHVLSKGLSLEPLPGEDVIKEAAAVNRAQLEIVIRRHQDTVLRQLIEREAGKEAFRRELLEMEKSDERLQILEDFFTKERVSAANLLKTTQMAFEGALNAQLKKYFG